jgi:N-acetylneuraminate synthase
MKPKIVAEIGINHNGDMAITKSLIAIAKNFGADYVKFQKKNPDICVPESEKDIIKNTIFGPMKYIDYKKKMEFGKTEFDEIDRYCALLNIQWFASVWDIDSLNFIKDYNPPFIKIASASITDIELLKEIQKSNIPVILSTGMSDKFIIDGAIEILGNNIQYLLHTTSSYPTPSKEMNMNKINTLKKEYGDRFKIGYSNHSEDIIFIVQSYIMGVDMIEFHVTLDRNMNGTDQRSSIGPMGFNRIIKHINNIEEGWGTGEFKLQNSEIDIVKKLRR